MKISVIIPVYNAEKYVAQAVESALQFDEVFEVILAEDRSPDNALEVCRHLAEQHPRVKLFQHPDKGNHGAGATRNLGIEKSTGDFIAFLDADDYYLPNRFDAEKEIFKNSDADGVYNAVGYTYYSEKAKEQFYHIYQNKLDVVYEKSAPEIVFPGQLYLKGSFGLIHLNGLTIRKSSLKKMNTLFNENLRLHQDVEFTIRLSFYLNLYNGNNKEAVALRGIHESNRISKVDSNKINRATTRVLMWNELFKWADNEPKMSSDYKIHIKRMQRSYQIANAPFFEKWMMILKYVILDYKSIRSGLYNVNFRKDLF